MENKFKKGLILGGLLAAGAALGFSMSHEGQELTDELQKDLKNLSKQLKKSLHQMEDVSKKGFDELVNKIVEEYAKKKELANDAKKILISALEKSWHEMEEEYMAEKDKEE